MKIPYNIRIIKDYIENNNLTVKAFCEKCGISASTFYKIMQGENVQLDMLYRIKRVMNIDLKDFFLPTVL